MDQRKAFVWEYGSDEEYDRGKLSVVAKLVCGMSISNLPTRRECERKMGKVHGSERLEI